MLGVGQHHLFVLEGDQAAAFDFTTASWRQLPEPPAKNAGYGGLGESLVVAVGLDCPKSCVEGAESTVIAASLDLGAGETLWKTAPLDVPVRNPEFFSPAMIGELGGNFVVGTGRDLLALTPELEMIRLPVPPTSPVKSCVVGDSLQSLVRTVEAQALPIDNPPALADPLASHTIARASAPAGSVRDLAWEIVPTAVTADLTGSSTVFTGLMCGPQGVVVLLGNQTYEWNGATWINRPVDLTPYGVSASVQTSDGRLAATSGNRLAVLGTDGWTVAEVSQRQPPGVQVAAVGNRLVIYEAPRSPDEPGMLREVAI